MLVEKIVSYALQWYLGDFVDFKRTSIRLSLWRGGDIRLENVCLREDLLSRIGLPIQCADGEIESLRVLIPWSALWSASVVVEVSGVHLSGSGFVELQKLQEDNAFDTRTPEKDKREEDIKSNNSEAEGSSENAAYSSSRMLTLLHNFKIKLENIAVMYQCDGGFLLPKEISPAMLGLKIGKMELVPTDSQWKPSYVTVNADQEHQVLFKMINLEGVTLFAADINEDDTWDTLMDSIAHPDNQLLRPASVSIKAALSTMDGYHYHKIGLTVAAHGSNDEQDVISMQIAASRMQLVWGALAELRTLKQRRSSAKALRRLQNNPFLVPPSLSFGHHSGFSPHADSTDALVDIKLREEDRQLKLDTEELRRLLSDDLEERDDEDIVSDDEGYETAEEGDSDHEEMLSPDDKVREILESANQRVQGLGRVLEIMVSSPGVSLQLLLDDTTANTASTSSTKTSEDYLVEVSKVSVLSRVGKKGKPFGISQTDNENEEEYGEWKYRVGIGDICIADIGHSQILPIFLQCCKDKERIEQDFFSLDIQLMHDKLEENQDGKHISLFLRGSCMPMEAALDVEVLNIVRQIFLPKSSIFLPKPLEKVEEIYENPVNFAVETQKNKILLDIQLKLEKVIILIPTYRRTPKLPILVMTLENVEVHEPEKMEADRQRFELLIPKTEVAWCKADVINGTKILEIREEQFQSLSEWEHCLQLEPLVTRLEYVTFGNPDASDADTGAPATLEVLVPQLSLSLTSHQLAQLGWILGSLPSPQASKKMARKEKAVKMEKAFWILLMGKASSLKFDLTIPNITVAISSGEALSFSPCEHCIRGPEVLQSSRPWGPGHLPEEEILSVVLNEIQLQNTVFHQDMELAAFVHDISILVSAESLPHDAPKSNNEYPQLQLLRIKQRQEGTLSVPVLKSSSRECDEMSCSKKHYINLPDIEVNMEPILLRRFIHVIGSFGKARECAKVFMYGKLDPVVSDLTATPENVFEEESFDQKSELLCSIESFQLNLLWGTRVFAELETKRCITKVYFSPSQFVSTEIRGTLQSVQLRDKCGSDNPVFSHVVTGINPSTGFDAEWYFSTAIKAPTPDARKPPVLNARVSGFRFVHLQRVTMDLVSYIRDHIINDALKILQYPPEDVLSGSSIQHIVISSGKLWLQGGPRTFALKSYLPLYQQTTVQHATESKQDLAPTAPIELGFQLLDFEGVVPSSSSLHDGLVVKSPIVSVWYSWGGLDPSECKGTFLTEGTFPWEDLAGVRSKFGSSMFSDDDFVEASNTSADLQSYLEANKATYEQELAKQWDVLEDLQQKLKSALKDLEGDHLVAIENPSEVEQLMLEVNRVDELERAVDKAKVEYRRLEKELEETKEELNILNSSETVTEHWGKSRPKNRIDIEITDACFSSILSNNIIGEKTQVQLWIAGPQPLTKKEPYMYPDLHKTLGFAAPLFPPRSTPIDVTVLTPNVNFTFTESQYTIILDMIFENFGEDRSVPVEWPVGRPVSVQEDVIENPLKGRNLQCIIPVYFTKANITVKTNDLVYYERLNSSMTSEPNQTEANECKSEKYCISRDTKHPNGKTLAQYQAKHLLFEINRMTNCDGMRIIASAERMTVIDPNLPDHSFQHQILAPKDTGSTETQIKYVQENCPNYRNCSVYVNNTVVRGTLASVWEAIFFWCDPVWDRPGDPYAQEMGKTMDVVVKSKNIILCLSNQENKDPKTAVQIEANLEYIHQWRNLFWMGPGNVYVTFKTSVYSIFVGPTDCSDLEIASFASPFNFERIVTKVFTKGWTKSTGDLGDRVLVKSTGYSLEGLEEKSKESKVKFQLEESLYNLSGISIHLLIDDVAAAYVILQSYLKASEEYGIQRTEALQERQKLLIIPFFGENHMPDQSIFQPKEQADSTYSVISDLSFTVANHATNDAVFQFTLEGMKMEAHHEGAAMSSLMEGAFNAAYFNKELYLWEPAIESATMVCEMKKKDITPGESQTHVQISIPSTLNVNLSPALTRLVIQEEPWVLAQKLQQDSSKMSLTKPVSHQYSVNNRTGCLLRLILQETELGAKSPGSFMKSIDIKVEDGQDFPLDFRVLSKFSSLETRKRRHYVPGLVNYQHEAAFLQLDFFGWVYEAQGPIPLDVVGLHILRTKGLHPCENEEQRPASIPEIAPVVVAEVRLKAGFKKEIILRGLITVTNNTAFPMEVLFYNTDCHMPSLSRREILVEKGCTEYCPLYLVHPQTSVGVRLHDDFMEWGLLIDKLQDIGESLEPRDSIFAVCPSVDHPASDDQSIKPKPFLIRGWCVETEIVKGSHKDESRSVPHKEPTSRSPEFSKSVEYEAVKDHGHNSQLESKEDSVVGTSRSKDREPPERLKKTFSQRLLKLGTMSTGKDKGCQPCTPQDTPHKSASPQDKPTLSPKARLHLRRKNRNEFEQILDDLEALKDFIPAFKDSKPKDSARNDAWGLQHYPLSLELHAPLVLQNLLCLPLLYRLVVRTKTSDETRLSIVAEGVLEVGAAVPFFQMSLRRRHFLSCRIINYPWSSFLKVHDPETMHPVTEQTKTMELKGSKLLRVDGKGKQLPDLALSVGFKDRYISIFSQLWVINRTGFPMKYRESTAIGLDSSLIGEKMSQITHQPQSRLQQTAEFNDLISGEDLENQWIDLESNLLKTGSLESQGKSNSEPKRPSNQDTAIPLGPVVHVEVQLPTNHLTCKVIKINEGADLKELLQATLVCSNIACGPDHLDKYFFIYGTLPDADRRAAFSEMVAHEVERSKENAVEEQLRSLKQHFNKKDPQSFVKKLGNQTLGFLMDVKGQILSNTMKVGELPTPRFLRLCHMLEFQLMCQTPFSWLSSEKYFGSKSLIEWGKVVPFSPPSLLGVFQLCARVIDSEWSNPFPVQDQKFARGLVTGVTLKQVSKNKFKIPNIALSSKKWPSREDSQCTLYSLGMHVESGHGQFNRTTVLTFVPRYILVNELQHPLEYSQACNQNVHMKLIPPESKDAFHWPNSETPKKLKVRFPWQGCQWSGDFSIDNLGTSYVALRRERQSDNVDHPSINPLTIIQVRVELIKASIVIIFCEMEAEWPPYRIDNFTSFGLRFQQVGKDCPWTVLRAGLSSPYAWDLPSATSKQLRVSFHQMSGEVVKTYKLDEFEKHRNIRLQKNLPDLSNPSIEGGMEKRVQDLHVFDSWALRWFILKKGVLYMFRRQGDSSLKGAIYVSVSPSGSLPSSSKVKISQVEPEISIMNSRSTPMKIGKQIGKFKKPKRKRRAKRTDKEKEGSAVRAVVHRLSELAYATMKSGSPLPPEKQKIPVFVKKVENNIILPMSGSSWASFTSEQLGISKEAAVKLLNVLLRGGYMRYLPNVAPPAHPPPNPKKPNAGANPEAGHLLERFSLSQIEEAYLVEEESDDEEVFKPNFASLYGLVPIYRDLDLNLAGRAEFEIRTMSGTKHTFRCGSMQLMVAWVVALRDAVDAPQIELLLSNLSGNPAVEDQSNNQQMEALRSEGSEFRAHMRSSIAVRVRADGPTKVLEFSEEMEDDVADTPDFAKEGELSQDQPRVIVSVQVRSLGISIIDDCPLSPPPKELVYLSFQNIYAGLVRTATHHNLSITVEDMSLDDQYPQTLCPCVMRVRPLFNGSAIELDGLTAEQWDSDQPPAFHFYLRRKITKNQAIFYYDALTLWVRPWNISVADSVLLYASRLKDRILPKSSTKFGSRKYYLQDNSTKMTVNTTVPVRWHLDFRDSVSSGMSALSDETAISFQKRTAQNEVKIYFALLHLHPLDIELSLTSTLGLRPRNAEEIPLTSLAAIDGAQIKLNALHIEHGFGGRAQIVDVIVKHYQFAALKQLGTLLGSFDFLGNPVGLVNNLGSGVKDFFYEPLEGLKPDGKGFLYGLGKGTNSLVANTIDGTFNFASKITGTFSHGLANLTMDSKYQRSRAKQRAQQPKNVGEGFLQGGFDFGKGFVDGVTGVVMHPIRGAEKGGVVGLGTGLVKGLVGVVVKPTVGALDLVTRSAEGVRNMGRQHLLQDGELLNTSRARPPRAFGPRGELKPYCLEAATGQDIVRFALKGAFEAESLTRHLRLVTHRTAKDGGALPQDPNEAPELCIRWLLCTKKRLLYVEEFQLEGERLAVNVLWTTPLQFVSGVSLLRKAQAIHLQLMASPNFSRGVNFSREVPTIYSQNQVDAITVYSFLAKILGKEIAEQHIRGPPLQSIAMQANFFRVSARVMIPYTLKRWYVISANVLYEFREPSIMSRSNLTMMVPLTQLAVSCGSFDGYDHAIRLRQRGSKGKDIRLIKREDDSDRLRTSSREELLLVMDSKSMMERWALTLYQNTVEASQANENTTLSDLAPDQDLKAIKVPSRASDTSNILFLDCFHLDPETNIDEVSQDLKIMVLDHLQPST